MYSGVVCNGATAVLYSVLFEVSLYCGVFCGGVTAVLWRHYCCNPIRLTGR